MKAQRANKEIKEDHSQVVLTADKEVAMVVMDREDYTDKAPIFTGRHEYLKRPSPRTLLTNSKINFPKCSGT